jgi:hypothetical protein
MDQLDPSLIQRVNTKVSAVVDRYLLDDQEVTPQNTRKAYGPKQAEWMVSQSVRSRPATTETPTANQGIYYTYRNGASLASQRSHLDGRRSTR